WVPHSTYTSTACPCPVAWAYPCAALSATISLGHVITRGNFRPAPAPSASASRIGGWSLPKFANRYDTPHSVSASRNAVLVVYIGSDNGFNQLRPAFLQSSAQLLLKILNRLCPRGIHAHAARD